MALIRCPECGREASDKAVACPQCSYPIAANLQQGGKRDDLKDARAELLGILQARLFRATATPAPALRVNPTLADVHAINLDGPYVFTDRRDLHGPVFAAMRNMGTGYLQAKDGLLSVGNADGKGRNVGGVRLNIGPLASLTAVYYPRPLCAEFHFGTADRWQVEVKHPRGDVMKKNEIDAKDWELKRFVAQLQDRLGKELTPITTRSLPDTPPRPPAPRQLTEQEKTVSIVLFLIFLLIVISIRNC